LYALFFDFSFLFPSRIFSFWPEKHPEENIVSHVFDEFHGNVAYAVHARFDLFQDSDERADYFNAEKYENGS
jgi:hypothetical protein